MWKVWGSVKKRELKLKIKREKGKTNKGKKEDYSIYCRKWSKILAVVAKTQKRCDE
jgi:hypothetical protein